MKPNKKALLNQREVIERRLRKWMEIRSERVPPSGWVKAIRASLGMSSSELGRRMGLDSSGVLRLEEREAKGVATIEMIQRAARAMNCKLVYALVPEGEFNSLEDVIDQEALKSAEILSQPVTHSMKLEKQGVDPEQTRAHVQQLAEDLKNKMDPLLWNPGKEQKRSKK